MLVLTAVVIVLTGIQSVPASTCGCSGFGNCSWASWSTQVTGVVAISVNCSTGVPVWRGCSCQIPTCYSTKCELYACGQWTSWGGWSASCGTRIRHRSRSCNTASNVTYSDANVTRSSDSQPVWQSWSSWLPWSAPCGTAGRSRSRSRVCYETRCPADHDDLSTCLGTNVDRETEFTPTWDTWSLWGQWTAACGRRVRTRMRNCTSGMCGASTSCSGPSNQTETDSTPPCCLVNAVWSAWGDWTTWSTTCGSRTHLRRRSCAGASCGGLTSCSGVSTESQLDSSPPCCPVDANWSNWSDWSSWSASCGNRSRQRTQTCSSPFCGGIRVCSGTSLDTQVDSSYPPCPVATSTESTIKTVVTSRPPTSSQGTSDTAKSEKSLQTWVIAVVAASSALALFTLIIMAVFFWRRTKRRKVSVGRAVERSNSFYMDVVGGSFYSNPLAKEESSNHKGGNNTNNSLPASRPAGRHDLRRSEMPDFTKRSYKQSDTENLFAGN